MRCYQRLLFLNALRMVVAFRSYKRDISERNKELSVKDRRDALPFLVFVQMREVGISIPWKRIRPKWKKGGVSNLTESEYLTIEPGTFKQKLMTSPVQVSTRSFFKISTMHILQAADGLLLSW